MRRRWRSSGQCGGAGACVALPGHAVAVAVAGVSCRTTWLQRVRRQLSHEIESSDWPRDCPPRRVWPHTQCCSGGRRRVGVSAETSAGGDEPEVEEPVIPKDGGRRHFLSCLWAFGCESPCIDHDRLD